MAAFPSALQSITAIANDRWNLGCAATCSVWSPRESNLTGKRGGRKAGFAQGRGGEAGRKMEKLKASEWIERGQNDALGGPAPRDGGMCWRGPVARYQPGDREHPRARCGWRGALFLAQPVASGW